MKKPGEGIARDAVVGQAESVERLKVLIDQAQRGEIDCVAVRLFQSDGTWEDVVIGGASDEEREAALEALRASHRVAN